MSVNVIDGILFEKLIVGGALNLKVNVQEVNDLNVFPIPDGDTGDNMYMTLSGGIPYLRNIEANSICQKAEALAKGMLLNARGNSGVILSQMFYGLAKGLDNLEVANVCEIQAAFRKATEQAYSSVVKPVEGTILTVIREAAEYAKNDDSINSYLKDFENEMEKSLENTPELLATLKEAGVIDSGGAGLLYIIKGFNNVLDGKKLEDVETKSEKTVDLSKFTADSVMEFGYCTEFLLQLQNIKVDAINFDINKIVEYLETIGDSIVAYKTDTIVKIHVHTLTPYKALAYCHQFGEFLTVKIENMTLQHNEIVEKKKRKAPRKKYGVVTVATGKGLIDTFYEFGVDEVIDGGQGKNPSTKTFLEAFENVNADYIYVLPNNSNIIMTANEAKELYKESSVFVIPTKDFGQAYSALSLLDFESDDPDQIAQMLESGANDVTTGMITKSIRDANINAVEIHEGDYIGFSNKTMYTSKVEILDAYYDLLEKLKVEDKEFLINVYGDTVTNEQKEIINKYIRNNYPSIEVYEIDGGQEVYDIIVILE